MGVFTQSPNLKKNDNTEAINDYVENFIKKIID
jgi:hypothetical protein